MALRDPAAGIGIDLGEAVRHERGACVACPLRGHEDVDVADEACRRIGLECIAQAGGPLEEHRIHAVVGQIGRASCRERVCQYVYISVVAVSLKTNKTTHTTQSVHNTREKHTTQYSTNT